MVARFSKLQVSAQLLSALSLVGMCVATWQSHRSGFNFLAVFALSGAFFGGVFQSSSVWHRAAFFALYIPSFVLLLVAEFGALAGAPIVVARGAFAFALAALLVLHIFHRPAAKEAQHGT